MVPRSTEVHQYGNMGRRQHMPSSDPFSNTPQEARPIDIRFTMNTNRLASPHLYCHYQNSYSHTARTGIILNIDDTTQTL